MNNELEQKSKYLCIHGHFYQPPRENPWLEEIEIQDSAAPYHDWNEKITMECYRPNTAARLVNEKNKITRIVNNYSKLSFNIGPTLLSWLRKKQREVYDAIIKADQISQQANRGHGNAIAQVYNHIIMPLAPREDKVTQVKWGIRDFVFHFGRFPEGMWLAETAVDLETLSILAENGITFTILSPYQASRCRLSPNDEWKDVTGGKIDPRRAYRCSLPDGRWIYLFFYDASLARGVAFENYLADSHNLITAIKKAYPDKGGPWLVHYATDGESYGHHFKFGEMALAAAFEVLEKEQEIEITNYANYLDLFPGTAEVEIIENSSWSCAHGVERWRSNCGCRIGTHPEWQQEWRAPLRNALDRLRDHLTELYMEQIGKLSKDIWAIRNDYIEVILNPESRDLFLQKHIEKELTGQQNVLIFQLLEMQRCMMLMFTSCGWFFDEISGLETVQILCYAARAMQLAVKIGASPEIESDFLTTLESAPSNIQEYQNGAGVYEKKVKPQIVTEEGLIAHYGITLSAKGEKRDRLFCYEFNHVDYQSLSQIPASCFIARIKYTDLRILDGSQYIICVAHFGGLDFRCSIKPYSSLEEYEQIKEGFRQELKSHSTTELVHFMDKSFGKRYYTLKNCFLDDRRSLARKISEEKAAYFLDFHRIFYEENRLLMAYLQEINVPIPDDFLLSAEKALTEKLCDAVGKVTRENDLQMTGGILDEAGTWGIQLDCSVVENTIGKALTEILERCFDPGSQQDIESANLFLDLCEMLRVKPYLWKLQNLFYEHYHRNRKVSMGRWQSLSSFLKRLEQFLNFCLNEQQVESE